MTERAPNEAGYRLPGTFFLLAALLNLIAGTVLIGVGVQGHLADYRRIEADLMRDFPGQHREMEASGWSLGRWVWSTSTACIAMGLGGLVSGGTAATGVWKISRGESRRTAIVGAILMSVPLLSPSACVAIGPLAALWMILTILDEMGQLPSHSN
jgi:hypothetical protein